MLIYTTKGLIEESELTVNDHITLEDNARVTVTEWFLGKELVRRDVNVNVLRALDPSSVSQQNI